MCDHSKIYKCLIWAKLKFHLFWLDTWSVTVSSALRPSLLLPSFYLTHDRGLAVNYTHSCYKLYLYRQLSYQFLLTKYCKQFVMRVRKKTSSSVSSKLLSIKIPVLQPPKGRPLLLENASLVLSKPSACIDTSIYAQLLSKLLPVKKENVE